MNAKRQIIKQADPSHPDVHVWESHGRTWACCCYDHGPMCRLCQLADETLLALLVNVLEGKMLARADKVGEFQFKVTPLGLAAAEDIIHNTLDGADLWSRLQARGFGKASEDAP